MEQPSAGEIVGRTTGPGAPHWYPRGTIRRAPVADLNSAPLVLVGVCTSTVCLHAANMSAPLLSSCLAGQGDEVLRLLKDNVDVNAWGKVRTAQMLSLSPVCTPAW